MAKCSCFQVLHRERWREYNQSYRRPSFPGLASVSAIYDAAEQMMLNGLLTVEMTLLLLQGVCMSVFVCECCPDLWSLQTTPALSS